MTRLGQLMTKPPPLAARRMVMWVTGSVSAALVPYWLNWLGQMYPDLSVSVVVTRSAARFVSIEALAHLASGEVWRDEWDAQGGTPTTHVELEQSADCFVVFPATLNSAMSLASGAAHSPALMCLQLTSKPVVVAPSFPGTNILIEDQLGRLVKRHNLALSEPVPAFSVGKKQWSGESGAFMPLVIEKLNHLFAASQTRHMRRNRRIVIHAMTVEQHSAATTATASG